MLAEPGHYDYAPYSGPAEDRLAGRRAHRRLAGAQHRALRARAARQSAQGAVAAAGAGRAELLPSRLRQPRRLLAHGRRHGQARRARQRLAERRASATTIPRSSSAAASSAGSCSATAPTTRATSTTCRRTSSALLIADSRDTIMKYSGQSLDGWLTPAITNDETTQHVLAEEGIKYTLDMVHDDQPMPMKVRKGRLISVPYSLEVNDVPLFQNRNTPVERYTAIVQGAVRPALCRGRGERHGDVPAAASLSERRSRSASPPSTRCWPTSWRMTACGWPPAARSPPGTPSTITTRSRPGLPPARREAGDERPACLRAISSIRGAARASTTTASRIATCRRPSRSIWPGKARVALWVAVHMGHFPMDMSGKPFVRRAAWSGPIPATGTTPSATTATASASIA